MLNARIDHRFKLGNNAIMKVEKLRKSTQVPILLTVMTRDAEAQYNVIRYSLKKSTPKKPMRKSGFLGPNSF